MIRKRLRRLINLSFILLLLLLTPYIWISLSTWGLHSKDPNLLGDDLIVVVLGTAKFLHGGAINPFYENRIAAAVELWETGKVAQIIVSGHGGDPYYDEPTQMRQDLIKRGIPESAILPDPDGLRTILSVRGLTELNQSESPIVFVSQKFHNQRAIYLARSNGLNTRGYNAPNAPSGAMLRLHLREILARHLALYESHLQ